MWGSHIATLTPLRRAPILDMETPKRHWIVLPKRGFIDFVQYVLHGVFDPHSAPNTDIQNATPFSASDKLRNAGRSLRTMVKEGLITEAELTGYRWTEIGRALAVALLRARKSIKTTESDPLPPPPGVWLDDLLDGLSDHALAALVLLPSIKAYEGSAITGGKMIPLLEKAGVLTIRRSSVAIDWAVPREAVLEFFRHNPDRIPGPHELDMPDGLRTADRNTLRPFVTELRLMRMEASISAGDDIWDIL